jgi:hypothetical protein
VGSTSFSSGTPVSTRSAQAFGTVLFSAQGDFTGTGAQQAVATALFSSLATPTRVAQAVANTTLNGAGSAKWSAQTSPGTVTFSSGLDFVVGAAAFYGPRVILESASKETIGTVVTSSRPSSTTASKEEMPVTIAPSSKPTLESAERRSP